MAETVIQRRFQGRDQSGEGGGRLRAAGFTAVAQLGGGGRIVNHHMPQLAGNTVCSTDGHAVATDGGTDAVGEFNTNEILCTFCDAEALFGHHRQCNGTVGLHAKTGQSLKTGFEPEMYPIVKVRIVNVKGMTALITGGIVGGIPDADAQNLLVPQIGNQRLCVCGNFLNQFLLWYFRLERKFILTKNRAIKLGEDKRHGIRGKGNSHTAEMFLVDLQKGTSSAVTGGVVSCFQEKLFIQKFFGNIGDGSRTIVSDINEFRAADRAEMIDYV